MAEEKRYTDIEKADAFYRAVIKGKKEIEWADMTLAEYEKSGKYKEYNPEEARAYELMEEAGGLSENDKEMVEHYKEVKLAYECREEVMKNKEKNMQTLKPLEDQIRVCISKYIVDAEKAQKNLEKNKEKYAAYVKEQKEKCEALKAELGEMDKGDVTYKDKEAELDALALRIKGMDKKLAEFDKCLAKVIKELNENKEKYKDYIDLAKENIDVPEEKENADNKDKEAQDAQEQKAEEKGKNKENDKDKADDKDKGENKTAEQSGARSVGQNVNPLFYSSVPGSDSQPVQDEKSGETAQQKEQKKETDKEAFKRIYKDLKKGRDISAEDTDRMLDIVGNKENFDKLGIRTSTIFTFTKSKGQKLFTKLGEQLDKQVRASVKDEKLLEKLDSKEITSWEDICNMGKNEGPTNNIADTLEEAMKGSTAEEKEALKSIKSRYEKYVKSTKNLAEVRRQRGEEKYEKLNEAPETERSTIEETLQSQVKSKEDVAKEDIAKVEVSKDENVKVSEVSKNEKVM